jgi:hypothetical protein
MSFLKKGGCQQSFGTCSKPSIQTFNRIGEENIAVLHLMNRIGTPEGIANSIALFCF